MVETKTLHPHKRARFQDDLSRFHLRSRKEISSASILDDYSGGKLSYIESIGGLLAQSLLMPSHVFVHVLFR